MATKIIVGSPSHVTVCCYDMIERRLHSSNGDSGSYQNQRTELCRHLTATAQLCPLLLSEKTQVFHLKSPVSVLGAYRCLPNAQVVAHVQYETEVHSVLTDLLEVCCPPPPEKKKKKEKKKRWTTALLRTRGAHPARPSALPLHCHQEAIPHRTSNYRGRAGGGGRPITSRRQR